MRSDFEAICSRARQPIDLLWDWKRRATAGREPIGRCNDGRATLRGDAAHASLQCPAGAARRLEGRKLPGGVNGS
jgi:hypothetical protein